MPLLDLYAGLGLPHDFILSCLPVSRFEATGRLSWVEIGRRLKTIDDQHALFGLPG